MRQFWMWLVIGCIGMGWMVQPVAAQDTVALELNTPISGVLGEGEKITYTFDVPITQDLVVTYDYSGLILSSHTVTTRTPETEVIETKLAAGGGGDSPGTIFFIIPAYSLETDYEESPYLSRQAELTLFRSRTPASSYTLTVATKTPYILSSSEQRTIIPEDADNMQILAIRQGLADPFTVQAESADGRYLWVANIPSLEQRYNTSREGLLIYPEFIDVADFEDDVTSLQRMTLYYAGEDNYRAVVYAAEPYTLNYIEHPYQQLMESQPLQVDVMPQIPLRFLQFDAGDAQHIEVTARYLDGVAPSISVYQEPKIAIKGATTEPPEWVYGDDSVTVSIVGGGLRTVIVHYPSESGVSRVRAEVVWTSN